MAFEDDNRQDIVFARIRGKSVCNFKHTLRSFVAQLAAAEIDIPWKVKINRLKFLKERIIAACYDHDDDN